MKQVQIWLQLSPKVRGGQAAIGEKPSGIARGLPQEEPWHQVDLPGCQGHLSAEQP